MTTSRIRVLVTSYLEPEHIDQFRALDERLDIIYEPDLLPSPRYPADHTGIPQHRTKAQEARWLDHLATSEIHFDFDYTNRDTLPDLAPNVRWIQGTSAGIGQLIKRYNYTSRMPRTIFTTASGVHAQPLAEFCMMSMLMFSRGLLRTMRDQHRHRWERFAGTDLAGRTLVILGYGAIGKQVARVATSFGMTVIGLSRTGSPDTPVTSAVTVRPVSDLATVLPRAEYLVIVLPHTTETEGLIGRDALAMLPKGAVVINIGRGAVLNEPALIEALRSGHLGGASLDVFAREPLPHTSPLWDLPNVLVSPHSGSTSDRENARLTDLFCENLRRYLNGEPLENVFDTTKWY
jgi:phosphoglycerate dehydrogenase-like enzyme